MSIVLTWGNKKQGFATRAFFSGDTGVGQRGKNENVGGEKRGRKKNHSGLLPRKRVGKNLDAKKMTQIRRGGPVPT